MITDQANQAEKYDLMAAQCWLALAIMTSHYSFGQVKLAAVDNKGRCDRVLGIWRFMELEPCTNSYRWDDAVSDGRHLSEDCQAQRMKMAGTFHHKSYIKNIKYS